MHSVEQGCMAVLCFDLPAHTHTPRVEPCIHHVRVHVCRNVLPLLLGNVQQTLQQSSQPHAVMVGVGKKGQ
jgi:hypothetical protein